MKLDRGQRIICLGMIVGPIILSMMIAIITYNERLSLNDYIQPLIIFGITALISMLLMTHHVWVIWDKEYEKQEKEFTKILLRLTLFQSISILGFLNVLFQFQILP